MRFSLRSRSFGTRPFGTSGLNPWSVSVFGVFLLAWLYYTKSYRWLAVVFLVIAIYIIIYNKNSTVEGFAIFSPKPIAYNTLIKDMYTPTELVNWRKTWDALPIEDKNTAIFAWSVQSPENQSTFYNMAVASKTARLKVENTR
jgi:hypothetical protein